MSTDAPIINVENLSYIRKGKNILSDVNWTINKGQNWVLFGPNGSGKTTLLKILTGYMFPSDGNAKVLGETIGRTNLHELKKRIGWISSSLDQFIHNEDLSLEIVVSGKYASTRLWVKASNEDFQKARDILDRLNCNGIADKNYGLLSQGEQKKILIARALMAEPELLVLDEPCEGLDIAAKERFLQDLRKMCQSENAPEIVLVTHHVEEILDIFHNILMLKNGEVFANGTINDVLNTESLTDLFEMPISLLKNNGRFHSEYF